MTMHKYHVLNYNKERQVWHCLSHAESNYEEVNFMQSIKLLDPVILICDIATMLQHLESKYYFRLKNMSIMQGEILFRGYKNCVRGVH